MLKCGLIKGSSLASLGKSDVEISLRRGIAVLHWGPFLVAAMLQSCRKLDRPETTATRSRDMVIFDIKDIPKSLAVGSRQSTPVLILRKIDSENFRIPRNKKTTNNLDFSAVV